MEPHGDECGQRSGLWACVEVFIVFSRADYIDYFHLQVASALEQTLSVPDCEHQTDVRYC